MSLRSSGTHCAVRGCTNNQNKLNLWLDQQCFEHAPRTKRFCSCVQRYSFHRLPTDEEAKRMWLKNLNLKRPPKTLYVCSFHFVDKKPTEENPHPTLWLGYERRPEKRHRVLKRIDSSASQENISGTGVFYQAMPAVGADGKNIMKLIPVKMVDGQFYQTQISKPKIDPTPQKAGTLNIASAPVQMVKKAALNPLSASSSSGSGLPSVVCVSSITTVNQGIIPSRDSALPSFKLLSKPSNETLSGPKAIGSKPHLKLIPKFSQRPNSPIKWTVEEEENSRAPTCDPLHSPSVTSEILQAVAERENANKHSDIITKPVSQLTPDKSGQGQENTLVMCNRKVFFVAKKCSLPLKMGKSDLTASASKCHEFKKNMVPSSQPSFESSAPEIRQDLRIIIPDESDEVIDLCDDDAQDDSTQQAASVNMSAVAHVDEDNVIFVSYIPPISESGSAQHLKLKTQMALVKETDQMGKGSSVSVTEQKNLDSTTGSDGRDEISAPGHSMSVSPVKYLKHVSGSALMNAHDNEHLNINSQQSTSTQLLQNMEVDVATESPADPSSGVCCRIEKDTHKMESSMNPTTSWTSLQEPKSHQMADHLLRQTFGITADVKICLQRIEEPLKNESVIPGDLRQKPTSGLKDRKVFLLALCTPQVTDCGSGLVSVKQVKEVADQEKSADAAIPSPHTHSGPLQCSHFNLNTKPLPALMCNSGQSSLRETSLDVDNEQAIDYVTPIDEDFLSTDEEDILNSQVTDATPQTPSLVDLNTNTRRMGRTRKRTICPCCIPGTQDPAVKSSTKALEPERWAWTTEQTNKKGGRTKVVRKYVKTSGRMNCLTAKNKQNCKNYEVQASGSLCATSMDSNELKQQEEIKRLRELLRKKETALELMRNSMS